jgi:uncharacterized protein involved in outer membrane biogenesis
MRRRTLIALCVAGFAALLAPTLFFALLDVDLYREPLTRQLARLTGREVRIGSALRPAGVLRPRFEIRDAVILGDPAVEAEEIARVDRLVIGLELWPLLRGVVRVDHIELEGLRVAIHSTPAGDPSWTPDVSAAESERSEGGVSLRIHDVDVEDARISYYDGSTGDTTRTVVEVLRFDVDPDDGELDLTARGAVDGLEFEVEGRVAPPAGKAEGPYVASLEGRVEHASFEASGTVHSPAQLRGIELEIRAQMPHLKLRGEAVPGSRTTATGRLSDQSGDLGFEGLEVIIGDREGDRVELRGDILDVLDRRHTKLDVDVHLVSLRALEPHLGVALPDLGPVRASGQLRALDGEIDLAELEVEAGHEGDAHLTLSGAVSDLLGLRDARLEASVAARALRQLAPALDGPLGDLGPVRGSAKISGAGGAYRLGDIDLEVGAQTVWARANGAIELLSGIHDADLELRFGAASTRAAGALFGVELPELAPVEGTARIRASADGAELSGFRVRAGRTDGVRLEVAGDSLPLPPTGDLDARVALRAPDLAAVGTLVGAELPATGPLRASGQLALASDRFSLRDVEMKLGAHTFSGSLSHSRDARGRPRFALEVASPWVHLDELLRDEPAPYAEPAPGFFDRELPLERLRAFDAELVLRADKVTGSTDLALTAFVVHAELDDGVLTIDPVTGRAVNGSFDAALHLDAREPEARLSLRADGREIGFGLVTGLFLEQPPITGSAQVKVDVVSRGNSGRALFAHADGDFTLIVRDGQIASRYLNRLRQDMMRIWRFRGSAPETFPAHCLVADIDLADGVAEIDTLLLDGDVILLVGDGRIDFARERYEMRLTPKMKSASLFAVTNPVSITGPLDAPVIRPTRTSLARTATLALAGNLVVPGVGLIAPFVHTGTRGRDPCAVAVQAFANLE